MTRYTLKIWLKNIETANQGPADVNNSISSHSLQKPWRYALHHDDVQGACSHLAAFCKSGHIKIFRIPIDVAENPERRQSLKHSIEVYRDLTFLLNAAINPSLRRKWWILARHKHRKLI